MKKKRLISVMLAGLMTAGVATMTGCDEEEKMGGAEELCYIDSMNNVYLILEQKDETTLHKGDISFLAHDENYGSASTGLTRFNLDCGEEMLSNLTYYVSETKPQKNKYDNICEDCFFVEY